MNTKRYTSTHEWIDTDSNEATIGITEHAQSLLGDIVFIELPQVGATIQSGQEFGVIESVKAASDLYAPASGEVIEINENITQNPALVNQDAHHAGWLIRIKLSHPEELNQLMSENQYDALIEEGH